MYVCEYVCFFSFFVNTFFHLKPNKLFLCHSFHTFNSFIHYSQKQTGGQASRQAGKQAFVCFLLFFIQPFNHSFIHTALYCIVYRCLHRYNVTHVYAPQSSFEKSTTVANGFIHTLWHVTS